MTIHEFRDWVHMCIRERGYALVSTYVLRDIFKDEIRVNPECEAISNFMGLPTSQQKLDSWIYANELVCEPQNLIPDTYIIRSMHASA